MMCCLLLIVVGTCCSLLVMLVAMASLLVSVLAWRLWSKLICAPRSRKVLSTFSSIVLWLPPAVVAGESEAVSRVPSGGRA